MRIMHLDIYKRTRTDIAAGICSKQLLCKGESLSLANALSAKSLARSDAWLYESEAAHSAMKLFG